MLTNRIPGFASKYMKCAAVLLLATSMTACLDDPQDPTVDRPLPALETRPIARPVLPTLRSSAPSLTVCGTPVEFTMSDGFHQPGKVIVSNDAERLYVTYTITTADWFISDTRLAISKTQSGIPRDDGGNPAPWSFPIFGEHDPVITSFTYAFKLTDLAAPAGTVLYVSAMAGVVHPTTSSYEGPWEWLVVWGLKAGSNNAVHAYTVASCGGTTPPPPPPPQTGSGVFTITFDDGFIETYTRAFAVLREFGMPANVAVNPQPVDELWGGYMTLPMLRELHTAGWDIVSHTLSHRDITTLSATELTRELRDSKAWIEAKGFRGSHIFVVPFHSWGARERTAIQQHYRAARGYTVNQFSPPRFSKYPITQPYDLMAYEPEWAPFTTADGRTRTVEQVQRAIANGEFVDLFFHRISESQLAGFRELIRMLSAHKGNLRTYTQVVP